jgi:hypothetical protein
MIIRVEPNIALDDMVNVSKLISSIVGSAPPRVAIYL